MHSVTNAMINSLLCYLSSARKTYSEQAMVATCLSFYSSDKIEESKEILFKCLDETIPRRRGDNKSKSDLHDMLETLKKVDANKVDLPKFLCDSHGSMPPASGFEVISEHLLGLVVQVNTLNEQVRDLKLNSERKDDAVLREMREDVRDMKLTLEEKKSHQKDSFLITQNRFRETKPIAKPKPLNLPGPSNFTLQSEGSADVSTADNTDAASRDQLILTDLRDKVITTSAEEVSQTNEPDNVQALEDI